MMLAPIDPVLTIHGVCRLLKISPAQFYNLKARGEFGRSLPPLIPIHPQFDRKERFQGQPFALWLSAKEQARRFRAQLQEAQ